MQAASTPGDTATQATPTPRSAWPARLVVGVVLANIILVALAALALQHSRAQYQQRADTTTQNLARLFEQNIRGNFSRIDQSLRLLSARLPAAIARGARADAREMLESHLGVLSDIKSIQAFDAQGGLVATTNLPLDAPLNVRGHPVFEGLKEATGDSPRVFKPVRSVMDDQWVVVIGRRLQGPGGEFAGVVSAALSLQYFQRLFATVDVGERGAIALRDLDNGMVARWPALDGNRAAVGDRRISPQALAALARSPEAGTFTAASGGSDGLERAVSFRRVEGYPFYVIVGISTEDALAGWQAELHTSAALLLVFAVVTTALAAMLGQLWRQRERELAGLLAEAETEREHFARLFHGSPVSTVIMSVGDWHIVDANDAFCQRYGVKRDEALGRTSADLGIGPSPEDRRVFAQQLMGERKVRNLVARVQLRSGEQRDSLITGELIDYQGRPCALASHLDITELRHAERAREAQAMAEAANRAKTDFLARMSHELRTPLNAVIGFSQLLRDGAGAKLTPDERTQLEHVHQAGWFLLTLTNDVLDMSRIEAGQMQVEPRPVALCPLLDDALQLSAPLARQHGITLDAQHRECGTLAVVADAVRLQQVVLNLLSNAIKYNRPGGAVQLYAWRIGEQACIEVVDTGLGMTGEQLAHLYEPFNRLGRERGGVEGSGIGLALTRQLVRLMQGSLELHSEAGRGTRARVLLPWAGIEPAPTPPERGRQPAAPAATSPGDTTSEPTGTVLYIEDNPVNALLVEQLLSRWAGVRYVHAENGSTGLALARHLQPDLVLLDMQLPDISGHEVLRQLRAEATTARLRVVALSANAMAEDIERTRHSGADDYWTKPIDSARFLAEVRPLLAAGNPG
ncbi:MAG: ATP-binding protein [Pseudomonadota bacterium]